MPKNHNSVRILKSKVISQMIPQKIFFDFFQLKKIFGIFLGGSLYNQVKSQVLKTENLELNGG